MKYRADIDGLRALAVIPVILFHAGFEYFSGGFVGVDIFFVISGYLITTIILTEKDQGIFSLKTFYERRARRILPALFLVMIVSIPLAWFFLLPSDMKDFSQSLIAVSLFSSNILFWQETGYWGVENELKPFLHTWSLAVEEQYYFIFPIFLMLMWRFRKPVVLASFIVIAICSLTFSHWAAYNLESANFFLLITRAWELAIGAVIAFYFVYGGVGRIKIISNKLINQLMSFIGSLLIIYSIIVFDESIPFPSLYALVPTLGAGLIILFSSKNTVVGQVLGSKVFVFVGLISYSAYLWHQPLFAFAKHYSLTEPSELVFSVLVLGTLLLAYISWRYVEKPFRNKKLVSSKNILSFWIVGSTFFIGFGLAGHITDGFNGFPLKSKLTQHLIHQQLKANTGLNDTCDGSNKRLPVCRTSKQPEILIWGDSFAMHLVDGILSSKPDAKIIQMTKSACGPFFNVAALTLKYNLSWAGDCLKFNNEVKKWLKENDTVKYVVVSSPFSLHISEGNKLLYNNGEIKEANINLAIDEFKKTLTELESYGVIPVVFSPPPSTGDDLGRCLAKSESRGLSLTHCDFKRDQMSDKTKKAYVLIESIDKEFPVIHLDDLICDATWCRSHIGNTWLYRDKGHLSKAGSSALGAHHDFYTMIIGNK
jgi:peptidoglycan/LPS O-acetylase OafA/YrhL